MYKKILDDLKKGDWPTCPSCGGSTIVAGGVYISCVSCNWTDRTSAIKKHPRVMKAARAKLSTCDGGGRGVLLFSTSAIEEMDKLMVFQRKSEISQRIVRDPIIRSMKKFVEKNPGSIRPLVTMNREAENGLHLSSWIRSQLGLEESMRFAADHDVAHVAWISDLPSVELKPEDARLKVIGDKGYLMLVSHFYGSPSVASAICFQKTGNEIEWDTQKLNIKEIPVSWIKQPVEWASILCVPGEVQPRWLSVVDVPGSANVTSCISEYMDGGLEMRVSVRKEGESPSIKKFTGNDYDKLLESLQLRMSKVADLATTSGSQVHKLETGWGLEHEPARIMGEIKMSAIWNHYATARK